MAPPCRHVKKVLQFWSLIRLRRLHLHVSHFGVNRWSEKNKSLNWKSSNEGQMLNVDEKEWVWSHRRLDRTETDLQLYSGGQQQQQRLHQRRIWQEEEDEVGLLKQLDGFTTITMMMTVTMVVAVAVTMVLVTVTSTSQWFSLQRTTYLVLFIHSCLLLHGLKWREKRRNDFSDGI